MIIQEYLMSVSTCRCRREPRWLFSFRLNIWILRVSKKKWVLVLSVPWYFVYYWLTQCAGLCGCFESSVMPDWALWVGSAGACLYFILFYTLRKKSQRNTVVLEGKNMIKKKMNSISSLMGLGHTLWVPVISSCSTLPSPPTVLSANALDLGS